MSLGTFLECFYAVLTSRLSLFLLFQSPTDNFFSSDPFKPSGSGSDSKKNTENTQGKDSSSSVKDPFSNPFGSDPFGEFVINRESSPPPPFPKTFSGGWGGEGV